MADLKAAGIHVDPSGIGRKLQQKSVKTTCGFYVPKPIEIKQKRVPNPKGAGKILIEHVLEASGLEWVAEFKFHPTRRWRADYFIPALNCIAEYEGLMSAKSRHTTVSGFVGDCEKYNEISLMGFKLLRYTALNVKCFSVDLDRLMQK